MRHAAREDALERAHLVDLEVAQQRELARPLRWWWCGLRLRFGDGDRFGFGLDRERLGFRFALDHGHDDRLVDQRVDGALGNRLGGDDPAQLVVGFTRFELVERARLRHCGVSAAAHQALRRRRDRRDARCAGVDPEIERSGSRQHAEGKPDPDLLAGFDRTEPQSGTE